MFLFVEIFTWQQDSPIQGIRQATMATADLHGNDDEFGERVELRRERRIDIGVSQRQAHCAVSGYDLEEDTEKRKSL